MRDCKLILENRNRYSANPNQIERAAKFWKERIRLCIDKKFLSNNTLIDAMKLNMFLEIFGLRGPRAQWVK